MLALPTTRQIQFLLALQQENSFHKAATFCGVTQSTLSAAIQEIENILGAPLLDRGNRKRLIFTPLGNDLLERGKSIIDSLGIIRERARQKSLPLTSTVRLGLIPTIAPYLLPKILRPLHKAFPKLVLNIHEQQSAALVEAVEKGELDAAIIAFPFETKTLQRLPLFHETFFCAVPKAFFPGQNHISLKDIETQKLLLLADGHCLRDHALEACHLKPSKQSQDVSATSLSTLIQLVAQSYGITLLPEMVIQESHLPKSVRILPIRSAPSREIGIIWRKNMVLHQDIVALGMAIYRLRHGHDIYDDRFNPTI